MAWVAIRKATDDDWCLLEERAARFIKRHNKILKRLGVLDFDEPDQDKLGDLGMNPSGESESEKEKRLYLYQLWLRIVRRALDSPDAEGIAYGYVGYWTE